MGKHYVPQHYLRAFASDAQRRLVWMLDKQARTWTEAAIKRVAQQAEFYPADVELQLKREVEDPGNEVLTLLRNGERISRAQRDALAFYLAVLISRVPTKRRKMAELTTRPIEPRLVSHRETLASAENTASPSHMKAVLRELDAVESSYEEPIPDSMQALIESPWPSTLVVSGLRAMCWRVLEAPEGTHFLTTDNPVHFFESRGLGNPDSEVVFTLSPSLALHASNQGVPGAAIRFVARPTLLREINRRLTWSAERFVFSPRRSDWIEKITFRRRAGYNKTVWSAPG